MLKGQYKKGQSRETGNKRVQKTKKNKNTTHVLDTIIRKQTRKSDMRSHTKNLR